MKKIFIAFFVALMVLGCNGNGDAEAKAAAQGFMQNFLHLDFAAAGEFTTEAGRETLSMFTAMTEGMPAEELEMAQQVTVEITSVTLDGETGVAAFITKGPDGEESDEIPLVKEDGAWKVDFSKEALQ